MRARNVSWRRGERGYDARVMRIIALAFASMGLALVAACQADLESSCVGGVCEPLPPAAGASSSATSASSSSGATGGSGGAGGSAPLCFDGCDVTKASGKTGEYPCAVERIMLDNCARCHATPTKSGAPFPLDTYGASQELYAETAIFARLKSTVESGFMPLSPPELTDDEVQTLVDWACACAPPRAPGETCR